MKIKLVCFFTLMIVGFSYAHPSWGMVVDKHRNIYFADIGHNGKGSVWLYTNKGELKLLLRDFHAHNVSLDRDGNVVTAHGEGDHTMVRRYPDGSLDTLYSTSDFHEFFGGKCTYSPDGEIIFGIDHYLWKIKDGKKQKLSEHYFEWSQVVYVDEEGIIYAPDIGVDNGILVRVDTKGNAQIIAEDLITKLDRPRDKHNDILLGITRGCDGFMYICENAGQRVITILENKQTETFYKSEGNWFPSAIDFFAGDAYILEYENSPNGMAGPQIVKVDEFGDKSVLFNYEQYQKSEFNPTALPGIGNREQWFLFFIGLAVITVLAFGLRKAIVQKRVADLS